MTRTETNKIERRAKKWNARLFNLKMSHKKFCELIGMKPPQLSRYINCRGNPPVQKTIDKINNKLKELENESKN